MNDGTEKTAINILTCNDTEQKNYDHLSVSLIHPLPESVVLFTSPHTRPPYPDFLHFFISVLCTMMALSGFDNQDCEDVVSG